MTAKKSTTKATEPTTLQEAAAAGAVCLFRQRKNGTLRSPPYLAPGSDAARKRGRGRSSGEG